MKQLFRRAKKLMLMKGHGQEAECSRVSKGTLTRLDNGTLTDVDFLKVRINLNVTF